MKCWIYINQKSIRQQPNDTIAKDILAFQDGIEILLTHKSPLTQWKEIFSIGIAQYKNIDMWYDCQWDN